MVQTIALNGPDPKIVRDIFSLFHLWRKAVLVTTIGMAGKL